MDYWGPKGYVGPPPKLLGAWPPAPHPLYLRLCSYNHFVYRTKFGIVTFTYFMKQELAFEILSARAFALANEKPVSIFKLKENLKPLLAGDQSWPFSITLLYLVTETSCQVILRV